MWGLFLLDYGKAPRRAAFEPSSGTLFCLIYVRRGKSVLDLRLHTDSLIVQYTHQLLRACIASSNHFRVEADSDLFLSDGDLSNEVRRIFEGNAHLLRLLAIHFDPETVFVQLQRVSILSRYLCIAGNEPLRKIIIHGACFMEDSVALREFDRADARSALFVEINDFWCCDNVAAVASAQCACHAHGKHCRAGKPQEVSSAQIFHIDVPPVFYFPQVPGHPPGNFIVAFASGRSQFFSQFLEL